MVRRSSLVSVWSGVLAASLACLSAGCDVGINGTPGAGNNSGSDGGSNVVSGDGLPCDVYKVLQTYCLSCHGPIPAVGTPTTLATYESLLAISAADAKLTNAQRSLLRMQDTNAPMPPRPASAIPASALAVFKAWVDAGAPKGSCGGADGGVTDPLNAAPTCTSGSSYTRGDNINMEPGGTCIACHTREGEGTRFQFAGTLFPTGHEPDRCYGARNTYNFANAKVIITDANGVDHTLPINSPSGNFGYGGVRSQPAVPTPYTAKVTYTVDGTTYERVMVAPQTDGDCNGCHTQDGDSDAPGRVTLPLVP